eukprot:Hpha_TRINITY_DN15550_c5_g1::TRINITY_DN15550_c5_g1_i1::g.104421::m.104421
MKSMALALLPAAVLAHPAILICQDPRLREGGLIMHHWVTGNQYSAGIDITASALTYKEGDTIDITVKNTGTAPYNNSFIAVQSSSWCTLTGDHGKFTHLSSDMAATNGCDSGIYSNTPTPFTGHSTAKWTAGSDTTGPVTLKLVWSNGPASSDPYAVSGAVRIPDTYLYIKTLTLNYTGPTPHCPAISPTPAPAPKNPGHAGKCVSTGDCSAFEGVGSPVFIQTLPQEASKQTFPSGRCLPCRIDHRHTCKSAMVECPSSWKQPQLVEKVWTSSKNCSGQPDRIVKLPSTHAHCPGPDHYSTAEDKLDLERFVPKLQRDHPSYFPDVMTARDAIKEYRRMLTVAQRFPGTSVVPSKLVDLVWHEHILDTKTYRRDTLRMFGEYIHHNPSFGGAEEKEELIHEQQAMFKNYAAVYGEAPPAKTWPQPVKQKVGTSGVMPDCCSAKCAKPDCHSCVGCNSVDCAYLAENGDSRTFKLDTELSPEAAAGYVPISRIAADLARSEANLKCSVTPQADMKLDWAICGDQIYFEHQLADVQGGWYGLGLSDKIPLADMSGADYVLTFPTGNYSGVKDAYRWAPGNGYPCFDVEYECSAGNATKGTYDLRNGKIVRQNGVTTSTWSRALKTPDYKDTEIANQNVSVLFARGGSDFFYYHNGDRNVCVVNFFTGLLDCQPQRIDPGLLPGQPH